MKLEMEIKIKEPESTLTRHESQTSQPRGTSRKVDIERHLSPPEEILTDGETFAVPVSQPLPEHPLLEVLMTFTGASVHLDVIGTDVSVEGDTIAEAYRRLIAAAKEHVAPDEGEGDDLTRPAPHTWFKFVSPDEAYAKALTERFNEAYDEEAKREDEEFVKNLKRYHRRRFSDEW